MNKFKKTIIISVVFLFLIPLTKIFSLNTKEAFSKKASFSVYQNQKLNEVFNLLKEKYKKREYTEALTLGLNLAKIAENNNDQELLVSINLIIGNIFEKTGNRSKAIIYYRKVNNYFNFSFLDDDANFKIKNDSLYVHNLFELGGNYQVLEENTKDEEKSKKYKDSSLYFYRKLIDYKILNSKLLGTKARTYSNLSAIYLNDSSYSEAKKYAEKAVETNHELGDKLSEAAALNNLASVYLLKEDFKKAKAVYMRAINLIKFQNTVKANKYREDLYYNYANTLFNLKDYHAYEYLENSYDIKDSLREISDVKKVEEIYAKYNVSEVKREEAMKQAEALKRTWLIILISSILIVILIFVAGFYRLRQKNLKLKITQNSLLQKQKLENLNSLSQKRILNATIDGKETERKEIAETLHDSVSTLLSSANLHLQASLSKFNGETPLEIKKSQEIINEASQKIRNLSHNLVSSILLKFGIKFAVSDLARKYSNSDIIFETKLDELPRYNQDFEIKIFNIINELINNILKHSKATKASIIIKNIDYCLQIIIADDGKGFDVSKTTQKDGLGINQIEARIQMMNGDFSIHSTINKGTFIEIEIPTTEEMKTTSLV